MKKIYLLILLNSFLFSSIIIKDNAQIIKNQKIMNEYKKYNSELIKDFDIDFRVITTNSDRDINEFSNYAFQYLLKKNRSSSGKGLLMTINIKQKKLKLEVSTSLETIYTDGFVSYIERKGINPYFRANKVEDAIYALTELIRDRAVEAKQNKEFVPPMKIKSIGAGAISNFKNKKNDKEGKYLKTVGKSPKELLKFYVKNVLKEHNKNPNLDIYTEASKKFWGKWVVTDINQNHEIKNLKYCKGSKTYYNGNYAVIRKNPEKDRKCSPYFFKKEKGEWKMDFATMSKTILFNKKMYWHFNKKERLKNEGKYYAFAFDGFTLDSNGYPHNPKKKYMTPKGVKWGFKAVAWYKPGPSKAEVKKSPNKYYKPMISYIYQGSYAEIRLGLNQRDYVHHIEINGKHYDDILYNKFFSLMAEARKDSVVKIYVIDYKGNTVIREGIAP